MPWIKAEFSKDFIAALERSGESEVRAALAQREEWLTHAGRDKVVAAWLLSKDVEKANSLATRSELRSEREVAISSDANVLAAHANVLASEANRVAADANSVARRAARWAMWAAAIATTSAIIAAKDQIMELISYLLK